LLAELGIPTTGGPTTAATMVSGDATLVLPVARGAPPGEAYPEPPPSRWRTPVLVAAVVLLALAGGALAYQLTRPSSSPADTNTFSQVTPSTTEPTTSATTTAPSTESTTEETTTQEAT